MTAPSPKQMRAMVDEWEAWLDEAHMTSVEKEPWVRTIAALRAAADRLEAVQYIANAYRFDAETAACIVSVRLDAILTANTAPAKPQIVDVVLEASRLQLEAEEAAGNAPQEGRDD